MSVANSNSKNLTRLCIGYIFIMVEQFNNIEAKLWIQNVDQVAQDVLAKLGHTALLLAESRRYKYETKKYKKSLLLPDRKDFLTAGLQRCRF